MTNPAVRSFDFGGEAIDFQLERTSRHKTVAISVGYDGVRVLAPSDVGDEHVLGVLRKKGQWILRKQAGYRELGNQAPAREFVGGESFLFLGRPYRLKVVADSNALVTRVTARGAHLVAPVPFPADELIRRSAIRSGLTLWYREKAERHFPPRLKAMAELLGIRVPSLSVVDQSKRWGSCDTAGRIRLNWRLVMAPLSLVDYVIAHEVCHVPERNHSRRFWRSLETIMPDYDDRLRRLDRMGHQFFW